MLRHETNKALITREMLAEHEQELANGGTLTGQMVARTMSRLHDELVRSGELPEKLRQISADSVRKLIATRKLFYSRFSEPLRDAIEARMRETDGVAMTSWQHWIDAFFDSTRPELRRELEHWCPPKLRFTLPCVLGRVWRRVSGSFESARRRRSQLSSGRTP